MAWQDISTALDDPVVSGGRRTWLAWSTGPDQSDWDMASCRYSGVGWCLSPNGEIGSPIHFVPTHWLRLDPPKE